MSSFSLLTGFLLAAGHVFAQTAPTPSLSAPTNGSIGVSMTPTLKWAAGDGNTGSFKLQICNTQYCATDFAYQAFSISPTTIQAAIPASTLLPLKLYYWRIIAFTGADNSGDKPASSPTWTFTTQDAFPTSAPTLVSPANASTGQPVEPLLEWDGVPGANKYRYQISKSTSFGSYVEVSVEYDNLTGTKKLNPSTLYYWRVQACNDKGCGPQSGNRSFTTKAAVPPGIPALSSPPNGAQITGTSVMLSWSATNAASYNLQVSSDFTFLTTEVNLTNDTRTSFTVTNLIPGLIYYWRVQAINTTTSAWSSVRTFTPALFSGPLRFPRGDFTINSPFGPRYFTNSNGPLHTQSWFHSGVDFGPRGGGFVAPYNMRCTYRTPGTGTLFRAHMASVDGVEPKVLMFEELELADGAKIAAGQSWTQGTDVGVRGGVASDAFIHMETCRGSDCPVGGDWYTNRSLSRNPLQWYAISSGTVRVEKIDPQINPLPTENGVRYFDVFVTETSPRYTFDKIEVSLTDPSGMPANQLFQNELGRTLSFNDAVSIDRGSASGGSSQESHYDPITPETTPLVGISKIKNGVKIFTEDFSTNATKRWVFRYYVTSDAIQDIIVTLYDCNGQLLNTFTRTLSPGCINCPGNGPLPPEYLSAKAGANGIDLRWNKSPDQTQSVYEYAIYRRLDGSSQAPQVIAMVPYSSRAYSDLMSSSLNGLLPGKKYRYSIASVGSLAEGCNGPKKPNCTGAFCPLACVQEVMATTPSVPMDLVFQGQIVRTAVGTLKARNSITLGQDWFISHASVTFQAGHRLDINDGIDIEDNSVVNLNVSN